ncbi:MAG: Cache 3/Cache 2 fusion domain-containing protein [Halioglobus sp.]|nr:Cache 3/Cache 2 fusion domain-containing protein [Halioglobus sp.]
MRKLKLLYTALLLASLALTTYLVVDYLHYTQERREQSIRLGEEAGHRVAEALDAQLAAIADRAGEYAADIAGIDTEKDLLRSIRQESKRFPLVLGVTVAYEPDAFLGKPLYAPFFNKSLNRFQFVEDSYDYTEPSRETAAWYTRTVATGSPGWSAPYYGEAARAMMVDYSTPLRNTRGDVIGVVDYSIALSDFTRTVEALSVGDAGYGFTYDADGAILTHPDSEYLLENIYQLKDGKDEAIVEQLRTLPQGIVAYDSTYTYKYSWFFFRELESTGWKSVLVFAEDDLLGASDEGRRKLIHITLGASLALVAVLLLALRVDRFNARRLWWLVFAVSIIAAGNIVVVWYLNLATDFSLLDNDNERIVNQTIMNKYADQYDRELRKLNGSAYNRVPTGIFIESYELSSFEASVIGRLWMKYPKALYDTAPPAFYFPDVSALETRGVSSELISEIPHDDYILVTWAFRATLEQSFSYQQFPFEQNDIRITVLYPDFNQHILLVPDLESYDILNPSVRPGLNKNVSVPSSDTISTFFTFRNIDYKTNFGADMRIRNHVALGFDMVMKRIWLSPFIANIIPILIVALIMFIVLFISSGREEGRSGMTTMNVIQSSAGFLFILLLAHVNERNRIMTPEIAYIEMFYFSMYVFITLEAIVLAMLLRGVKWRLFEFGDNLTLKLLFWPVLMSTWLAVTLVRFY